MNKKQFESYHNLKEVNKFLTEPRINQMVIKASDVSFDSDDVFDRVVKITETHVTIRDCYVGFEWNIPLQEFREGWLSI